MALNITKMRKDAGYTQKDIADILGIDQSTVAKWENGTSYPMVSTLPKLAKLFKCSIDDLFLKDK